MKIKVNLKCLMLVALFTTLSNFAFSQKAITGLVKDAENNEPLVGAAIVVTGTTKGTLTDIDGKYELQVPNEATTLTVSFTGYASLTVPISGNVVNVSLNGGSVLDAVVVVGYGSLKAKEVTSSITSVKKEDFNKGNIQDPVQLLQGKVAGLSISRPSGNPNGGYEIRLRGVSTIGANVQPLVVVDGIPGVDLKLVDPNDIESFDVLKDGSAAAIYGAQASSGVILITTKKGAAGKVSTEYSAQLSSDAISNTPSILSASEYKAIGGTDQKGTTDWYKEISRNALSQIHNLSLSGGLNKTTYRVSFNYRNAQGVLQNDGFTQLNGRFSLSQKALNDKLTFSVDGSATNRDARYGFNEAFRYATTHNPTAPVLDNTAAGVPYGGYFQISQFDDFNPVALQKQSDNRGKTKNLFLSGKAELELAPGLKLGGLYSIKRQAFLQGESYSRLGYFRGTNANGLASRFTQDIDEDYFNTTLRYTKDFNKLGFNAVVGYDYNERTRDEFYAQNAGFGNTDVLGTNSLESGRRILTSGDVNPNLQVSSDRANRKVVAFFGRAVLNYDDTYFGSLTLRREGSTMFGPDNKWGLFPAVSAGVALNKALGLSSFEQLKLRVGYGVTGALPPSEYLSQTTYSIGNNGSINAIRNGNPNLKWEQKAELSAAIDFTALNSRLNGTVEYYNRNISDMIYFFGNTAAGLFDVNGLWANAGTLSSKGFELALGYQILKARDKGGFNWKADFNIGTNESVIKTISTDALRLAESGRLKTARVGAPGLNDDYMILVQEGKPVGQIWTLEFAGVNSKGEVQVKSAKDGKIIGTAAASDDDRKVFGTGLPKATLGLTNSFSMGNLDFSFFLRGAFGHYIINENRIFYENAEPGSIKNYNRIKTKYWRADVKEAKWTSLYIEKGDFIKLDNFTLGYNFSLPANSAFSKVRAYVSGNNLLTITGYTGVDPEVRYSDGGASDNGGRPNLNGDPLAPGIDRRSNYYTVRSFSVGVNLGF